MKTLHDAFERQAGNAGTPALDVDELVGLGEHRLRRRRLTAALGAAAAVIVAVVMGVTALNGTGTQRPAPIDTPRPNEETPSTRPLVYSDVNFVPGHPESLLGEPIHVGDRVVETGSGWIHMDVTDDGVVYATGGYRDDGRLWFTDGGTPVQIASHACPEPHGWPHTVVTGDSGSLAAWFDCTRSHHAELVVFDTGSLREVGRRQVPGCVDQQTWQGPCLPAAIFGDRVYLRRGDGVLISSRGEPAVRAFTRDVRNNPRGLLVGDSWETATLFDGFAVLGRRLVPSTDGPPTPVFDTATRRPVRLHLSPGYQADHDERGGVDVGIFEWLDDDTVALAHADGPRATDILTCRLPSGRCELAVPARGHGDVFGGVVRVLPGQGLW